MLFAGASGSGKSTLLAALVDRGYAMLADDVTGVVLDAAGRPAALPAFPFVRLWADTVDELGWRGRTRERVREELDKHLAPVERFHASTLPVRAVFTLGAHNRGGFEFESAAGGDAFHLLLRYTYRKRYLRGLGQARNHFRAVTAMARRVPVTSVVRPVHPFLPGALADEIEHRLQNRRPRCRHSSGRLNPMHGSRPIRDRKARAVLDSRGPRRFRLQRRRER